VLAADLEAFAHEQIAQQPATAERRLRAEGAEEYGAGNTRLLALVHTVFCVGAFVEGWCRAT